MFGRQRHLLRMLCYKADVLSWDRVCVVVMQPQKCMLCVVTSAVDEGKPQNTFEEIAACAHLASRHPERALGELKAYYDMRDANSIDLC